MTHTPTVFDTQNVVKISASTSFTHQENCVPAIKSLTLTSAVADITADHISLDYDFEFATIGLQNCRNLTATISIYDVEADGEKLIKSSVLTDYESR